uniref:Uncharacterized protein n=1 Tax=Accipiter nisus TaxID=211598 RepID=A0A8B9RPR1_9AVES
MISVALWHFLLWNGIAMAPKGDQTFCTVLHPGEYCCISQVRFLNYCTSASGANW